MTKRGFFLSLIFPTLLNAQMLDNTNGLALTEVPFFNTTFIKKSNIKSIKGHYTLKRPHDVMRETKYVYVFDFDTIGNLQRFFKTTKTDSLTDTTVRTFHYNELGWLDMSRVSQKRGFVTSYYFYDENGRVITEEVYRDIDTLHSVLSPDIQQSILLKKETMKYSVGIGQLRKRIYNSNDKQYQEIVEYTDSLGYHLRTEKLVLTTNEKIRVDYAYNESGLPSGMSKYVNESASPVEEWKFTYDDHNNLYSKDIYKNGEFVTDYELIYSESTGLLYTVLIRDVATNVISIIQFEQPEFWNKPKKKKRR